MADHWVVKALVLLVWFLSVYLHELGHAVAAYRGGDREVRARGGFSPVQIWFNNVWISLVLPAILLLFAGFAFPGAATRINRARLRGPGTVSLVYLAGPAATALATLFLAGVYHLLPPGLLRTALALSIFLNVMSFLLNLLPLPSLDGFGAISAHLPARVEHWMHRAAVPTIVFLALLLLAVPASAGILGDLCARGAALLGVNRADVSQGFGYFSFGLRKSV